jgi:hypothetical protein
MAQTNYTPISLYYSTTASAVPTAANLVPGELAINTNDGKLYYEDSSGVVRVLASKSTGSIGGATTQVQYNSSGSLAGSANFVFDGTNVGIGTSSPNRLLSLYATQPVFQITNVASGNTQGTIQYQESGATKFILDNQGSGSGGVIAFQQAGTERMRIDSSGNLLVGTTTTRSNAGDVQVSKGISFPATQSAQSDANTLDDYEEGTWTPTITSSSGTITSYTSTGYYVKIGKQVTVWCNVKVTNVGTGTGSVSISSMPFTVNATDLFGIVAFGRETDITGVIWQGWSTSGGNGFNVLTAANGGLIGTNYRYVGSVTYTV